MAQRLKTIEYAFALSTASVASATARDLTQIAALAIPESTSRTFRSVILIASIQDNDPAAANLTAVLMGIGLGAVGRNDATVTQTIANSGEQQSFVFARDVTSYFATNYTGTTMTADCRVTVTGKVTSNVSAKLVITYEYDDSGQTTQIKTVRIAIDGNTGILTTSFANVGGVANQFPLLDNWLPEMSKTYRDIFFEMNIHQGCTAAQATNPQLDMRYDGSTTVSDLAHEDALASDSFYLRIDKLLGIATNAAHNIEAKVTQTAASQGHDCLNGVLVVTYEYNATISTRTLNEDLDGAETGVDITDATGLTAPFTIEIDDEQMLVTSIASNTLTVTRGVNGTSAVTHTNGATVHHVILNSLVLPGGESPGWIAGTATGDKDRRVIDFWIEEPGVPRLAQSGVLSTYIDAAAITLDFRAGSQASRTFAHAAAVRCGSVSSMRRIDSGGAGGTAGITLARGKNSLTLDWFTTSATAGNIGSNYGAVLYLNYYSRRHSDGVGVHNCSTAWAVRSNATGGFVQRLQFAAERTPVIPEANYWMNGIVYQVYIHPATGLASYGFAFSCERQSGEADAAGWQRIWNGLYASDAEIGAVLCFVGGTMVGMCAGSFRQWADDPNPRMDLETARNYRIDSSSTAANSILFQAWMWVTYHSITFSVSGTISDSAGGTVNLELEDDTNNKIMATGSRSGNGAYSLTCYDDVASYRVIANEDSTHRGASKTAVPGTGFDISLHTTGPGAGGQGISQGLHSIDAEIAA